MKKNIFFYICILKVSCIALTPSTQAQWRDGGWVYGCQTGCPFDVDLDILFCENGTPVKGRLKNNGRCSADDTYDDASVQRAAQVCAVGGSALNTGRMYEFPGNKIQGCWVLWDLIGTAQGRANDYQASWQSRKQTFIDLQTKANVFTSNVRQLSDTVNASLQKILDYKNGKISLSPDDIKNISNSLVNMQNTINQYQVDFESLKGQIPQNDPDGLVNAVVIDLQNRASDGKRVLDQTQNQKNDLQTSLTSSDMNTYEQIVGTTQQAFDALTKLDSSSLSSQRNQLIADLATAAGSTQSLEDLGITKRFQDLTEEYQKELDAFNAANNVLDKISDQTISANPTLRNQKQSAIQIATRLKTVFANMQADLTTNIPDLMTKTQQQIMTNQSADASQKAKSANANAIVILNQIAAQQANLAKNAPNDTIDPASLNGFIQNVNQIAGLIKEVQKINSLDSNSNNLLQQTVNTQSKFKDVITVSSIEAQQQSSANALKNGTAWQDVANSLGAIQKSLDQAGQTINTPALQTRLQTAVTTQETLKKSILDQASPQFDRLIGTLQTAMQTFDTAEKHFHANRNKSQGYLDIQSVVPQIVKTYQEIAALSSKIGLPSTKGAMVLKLVMDYNKKIGAVNTIAEKNKLQPFQLLSINNTQNGQATADAQPPQTNDSSPQTPAETS